MNRQLAYPIYYRVELMYCAAKLSSMQHPGAVVDVLAVYDSSGKENVCVPPEDTYNRDRFMAQPGTTLIGRGVLVEKISTEWFVAWRPFSPAPELVPLKD